MRLKVQLVSVVAVSLAAACLVSAGGDLPANRPGEPDPFVDKVVYVVTGSKDPKDRPVIGLYEKVKVIHLGDRFFLVGAVPAYGDESGPEYKAAAGKRVWTPISEVVQLTEFDSLDDAKRFFDSIPRGEGKIDR